LQELTKSHTEISGDRGLYTTPFLFLMNKAKYESLSAELKKVIDENSGMALAKLAGELWDGFEGPARKLAVDAGGEFHELSGSALTEMKTAGDKLIKEWIAEANGKGMDGDMLVKTARDLISKYEN
jgi:TRAP-type C4-dicarboxylate transport system substrate-binding protein